MIKGLLSSAKSSTTNALVKKTAGGMKKFAKGMFGQTSADYQSRVMGVGADGEYQTPEERKRQFFSFTKGTKSGQGTPSAARLAIPAAKDGERASGSLTDHLSKVSMFLQKLLILENNATDRLHKRILGTAREIDTDAAEAEERKQEIGKIKGRRKKDNPLMKGIKKKAGGIFDFLMTFGKAFVGFKLLQWLGDPDNLRKVTNFVKFFGGVVDFMGKIARAIGSGFNWTVEKLQQGVQLTKDTINQIGKFFSFEWVDTEGIEKALDDLSKIFTEGIPNLFEDIKNFLLVDLPDMFAEIGESVTNVFEPITTFLTEGLPNIFNEVISGVFTRVKKLFGFTDDEDDEQELFTNNENNDNPEKMEKGGLLRGPRHSGGGIPIEAEGGEYVLNRNATAGIERSMPGFLDSMNFGAFPAKGSAVAKPVSTFKFGGYVGPTFNAGNIIKNSNVISNSSIDPQITYTPKYEMGGIVEATSMIIPPKSPTTGTRLNIAQTVSNKIDLTGLGTDQVIVHDQGTTFTAGADETAFDSDSLGDTLAPFDQCIYGVRI